MTTGLLYDPIYLAHETGPGHPECPERLSVSMRHLHAQPWYDQLVQVPPRVAEEQWLAEVHDREYIKHVRLTCRSGAAYLDSMDVSICSESYDVALQAAGGVMAMADAVMDGRIDNGFGMVRPPGHHAESSKALGFCLFNNIAILARYLQKQHGFKKILILDWDVHHGNGTQHTFEEDPTVLYISTHQYPYYPGTGAAHETGIGKGKGYTLNCPMPAGSDDSDYEKVFQDRIIPAIDNFQPEFVLISAGFDAHKSDPLAQINLSTEFYGWMSDVLLDKAALHANGHLLSVLEGGYNLKKIPECIGLHVSKLLATSH
ncbi:MAG TPA: histone deacetylase [Gammaproteobacteria bacterium]|nr:histone deacetylase [Gammaproteobacteria bacterium]